MKSQQPDLSKTIPVKGFGSIKVPAVGSITEPGMPSVPKVGSKPSINHSNNLPETNNVVGPRKSRLIFDK